jgi:3-deoxy-manno-octulosonate cytidylyltransferase (CMP-KDO synthetase)
MSVLAVIPARYQSSRFPGKPLVDIGGKSMIQRVYEQVEKAAQVSMAIVATDDDRIYQHVFGFGGKVMMTSSEHQSGTDRVAEVAQAYADYDFVINIQGDEPFIDPGQIDVVAEDLIGGASISTLAKKIEDADSLFNSNVVKVVFNQKKRAMYFSRSTLPFLRNYAQEEWIQKGSFYKHIGLYGFERETLLQITNLPLGHYEQLEALEQLRWLEAGFEISVNLTNKETIGIDTPEDIEKIKKYL